MEAALPAQSHDTRSSCQAPGVRSASPGSKLPSAREASSWPSVVTRQARDSLVRRAMLLIELDGAGATLASDLERAGNTLVELGALDVLVAQKAGERERLWGARRELSRTLRSKARFKLSVLQRLCASAIRISH